MTLSLCLSGTKPTFLTNGMVPALEHANTTDFFLSQVTLEEATAKATEMNIMFMETSAKAGHNVKSLFKKIAMSLPGLEKETQGEPNTSMEHHPFGFLKS